MNTSARSPRIGHGFDAHRFTPGRPLILGGVAIPHDQGMEAHSDGDVVLHALIDALLGACGCGDIGRLFPDTSAEFKNIDSRILLRRAFEEIGKQGLAIGNVDLTIVAQRPRLAPYIDRMVNCIAEDLQCRPGQVNVKATTSERMGFTGRGEGIAAFAVALLT